MFSVALVMVRSSLCITYILLLFYAHCAGCPASRCNNTHSSLSYMMPLRHVLTAEFQRVATSIKRRPLASCPRSQLDHRPQSPSDLSPCLDHTKSPESTRVRGQGSPTLRPASARQQNLLALPLGPVSNPEAWSTTMIATSLRTRRTVGWAAM